MTDQEYKEAGCKLCKQLRVIEIMKNGCFEGPHISSFHYKHGNSNILVTIEQQGIRAYILKSDVAIRRSELWSLFQSIERLLMLFDGRFYELDSIFFEDAPIEDKEIDLYIEETKRRRLNYFSSDDVCKYQKNKFLNFDKVLNKELVKKWLAMEQELDIVHQVILYNMANTGITHDVKCAYLIESMEPLAELISEHIKFFPSLKFGIPGESLKLCIDAIISKYGNDIFEQEYLADKAFFLQSLVDTRNRIMHINKHKSKEKYLSGNESVVYVIKLFALYRIVLLDLLGIGYASYRDEVINAADFWNGFIGIVPEYIRRIKRGGKA